MRTRHFHVKRQPMGESIGHYHLTDSTRIDSEYNYKEGRGFYGDGQIGIYVFEENREKKPPHFHIIDNETSGRNLDIEVKIIDLSILCITDNSKHIKNDTRKGLTWEGYGDLRKELIKFLNKPYTGSAIGHFKNYYVLTAFQWNTFNPDNEVKWSDLMTTIK